MDAVVCKYNKYGYCKFKENCQRLHSNVVCQDANCEVTSCLSRHPRPCKYYRQFNYCKFGADCHYFHIENEVNKRFEEDIEAIRLKAHNLEEIIAEKDKQIKSLEEKIRVIEEENLKTKDELENIVQRVTKLFEATVLSTTDKLAAHFNYLQDAKAAENEKRFAQLGSQLKEIANIMKLKSWKPNTSENVN